MTQEIPAEEFAEGFRKVIPDPALVMSVDGEVLEPVANPDNDRLFYTDPDELVGKELSDVFPESKAERFYAIVREAVESGQVQTFEYELDVKEGRRYFEARVAPVGDEDRVFWFAEDVTARKRRHEERTLLERLLEVMPVGLVIVEPSGEISLANERAETIFGLDREEITSRSYDDAEWNITRDDGTPIPVEEHPVTRVLETGEPVYGFEHWVERSDGTQRWLSSNSAPVLDEDGNVEQVVVGLDDVTTLKEREAQLQWLVETEELADVSGWELHPESGTVIGTGGMRHMHETDDYAPSFEEALEFYRPEDRERLRTAVANCREHGTNFELEVRRRTERGNERWVRVNGERIEERGERKLRGVIRDITDLKEREQRLMVISRILRHNLRNKINVVSGCAAWLQEELDRLELPVAVRERGSGAEDRGPGTGPTDPADAFEAKTDEMQALVEEMSQFSIDEARSSASRIERAAENLFSLGEGVRQFERAVERNDLTERVEVLSVTESLASEYRDRYPDATIRVEGTVAAITGNRTAVRLLVENALENALKHNDRAEPTVTVTVSGPEPDRVRITVADQGPGLPELERRVLREGTETPLVHGSGIGLWTMNWLTGRLDGTVSIEDNDPRGTIVAFSFPPHGHRPEGSD